MRSKQVSSAAYIKKKRDQLFQVSKTLFSWQVYHVVFQIQLTFLGTICISTTDIILELVEESYDWQLFGLKIGQIFLSILAIVLVRNWPLQHNIINAIACISIHTIWAISEIYQNDQNHRKGIAYCIGMLSLMMTSNSSNLRLKFGMIGINLFIFCAFSHSSVNSIQYIIVAFIAACCSLRCEEKGREQLIEEAEWMHRLQDTIPQAILVVENDKNSEGIKLSFSNEKARRLFKLREKNMQDFCKSVTIIKKKPKNYSTRTRNFSQFIDNRMDEGTNKKNNNSLFYLDEASQSMKKTNLYSLILQKFKCIDLLSHEDLQKLSSLQSQDKKSTKTNIAAVGGAIQDFPNIAAASRSFYVQSINMMPSQRRILMLSQQAAWKSVAAQTYEEYECLYQTDSEEQKFCLSIGIQEFSASSKYIVMSFSSICDQEDVESKYNEINNGNKLFFIEEFCKQSLLKSTKAIIAVVQEIKTLLARSSVITEVELNRFMNSNAHSLDSSLTNNMKISSLSNGTPIFQNTSSQLRGVYCIPKKQLDNALQLSIFASSISTNYINFFAVQSMSRCDLDFKSFSLLQIIKNVQKIFQKQIDSRQISVILNIQEDLQDNSFQGQNIQAIAPLISTPNNLNSSSLSISNISLHNFHGGTNNQGGGGNNNFNLISSNQVNSNSNYNNNNNNNSNNNNNNTSTNVHSPSTQHNTNHINLFTSQPQQIAQLSSSQQLTPMAFNSPQQLTSQQKINLPTQILSQSQILQEKLTALQDKLTSQQEKLTSQQKQINTQTKNQGGSFWHLGSKGLDEVRNDESLVQHVIFILFQNAIENTPLNGTIAISLSRDSDQNNDNGYKIRIRNKCRPDCFFPFMNLEQSSINLSWREMLQEFKESGKFFYGIRMASQLASLVGPENSLIFKSLQGQEFQAEFKILNFFLEPIDSIASKRSDNLFDECSESPIKVDTSDNKSQRKLSRSRGRSSSTNKVPIDSSESFDKWVKIQSLEQQKEKNTLKIRTQLKSKN